MNLFRSEEHVLRWAQLDPAMADETLPVADVARIFGTESRRHLLDGNYISTWLPKRGPERVEALRRIGKANARWGVPST